MSIQATDRRTALRALGLVAASALTRSEFIMQGAVPAVTAADHLLLGVADLDRGIQWVEERTGVRPVVGGSHPGRGTRNALLSLGAKQYLEVIAPDPAQSTYTFQIDLRALKEPRLVTWAAATSDIDGVARGAKAAGQAVFGPSDGSRARPDGKVLKWRSLGVASSLAVGVVEPIPFFIQWAADVVHPATDSPGGCQLKALRIAHPQPAAVVGVLKAVGIDADVASASEAALYATVSTAKGVIELH
jgi:hypothetical protein